MKRHTDMNNRLAWWLQDTWTEAFPPARYSYGVRTMQLARHIGTWSENVLPATSAKQTVYRLVKLGMLTVKVVSGQSYFRLGCIPARPSSEPVVTPPAPVVTPPVRKPAPVAVPVAPALPELGEGDAALAELLRLVSALMEQQQLQRITIEGGRMEYEKRVTITRSFRL